jgi:hypothetical protein
MYVCISDPLRLASQTTRQLFLKGLVFLTAMAIKDASQKSFDCAGDPSVVALAVYAVGLTVVLIACHNLLELGRRKLGSRYLAALIQKKVVKESASPRPSAETQAQASDRPGSVRAGSRDSFKHGCRHGPFSWLGLELKPKLHPRPRPRLAPTSATFLLLLFLLVQELRQYAHAAPSRRLE